MRTTYAWTLVLALAGCGNGNGGSDGGADLSMNGPKDMAGGDLSMPGAKSYGFVSKSITLPASNKDYAVDLNGDGKAENQLGNIVSILAATNVDLQTEETASIMAGNGLELFGFNTADPAFLTDPNATVDVNVALPVATPKFDGTDLVSVDKTAPTGHLTGPLASGAYLSTDPKTLSAPPVVYLSIPVYTNTTVQLPLQGAWIRFTPTSSGLKTGQLNGAVKKTDVDKILVPALATTFTTIAMTMPCDANCMTVETMFDNSAPCTNPDGTMSMKGDHKIDICEVSGNVIIQSLLAPDVALFDSTGNWKPDSTNANKDCLSLGVAFDTAVAKIAPVMRVGAAVGLAACLCAARPSLAQSVSQAPPRHTLLQLETALARARLERNIGWGAAAVGLALTAAGAIAATIGPTDSNCPPSDCFAIGGRYLNGGGVVAGIGGAIAIAGAVLALYGQNSMTDLRAAIEQLGMRMPRLTAGLAPTSGGLLAGARVRF